MTESDGRGAEAPPAPSAGPPQDPVAAVERARARIRDWDDPALFLARVPEAALRAEAARLAAEGPRGRALYGRTVVVKDNIDVAGLPTTAACPAYAYTPAEDAPAVARLRAAGAIVLGKVNLDQFATGLVGVRSPHGAPRNALDPALIPGGSSSGSAAAVAAGIADLSLGTDTAGSGRVPAACNGIVGLKPSLGLVPTSGVVPACRSLDCVSVFARSLGEAAAALAVLAGPEAADPYARAAPPGWRALGAEAGVARIVLPRAEDLVFDTPDDAARFAAAATALGATRRVAIAPFLALAKRLYDGAWVAERSAALRGILTGQPEALHPVTRTILEAGLCRLTIDAFDDFHAVAETRLLARDLFAEAEALLLPTVPGVPTLAEIAAAPIAGNSRLGTYTNFVNLLDLCAVSVPAGRRGDGRPVGVTLVGPAWSEARLLAIAACLTGEALPAAPLAPRETALFCIGAHMSDLPLNHQVTSLGGRFLRTARTAPAYRLFALGNRPGMIRGGEGAIAGEVWALPTSAIGALLAQVPPPLGFGSVELEDGPCLGFLAEAAGVAGAEEITALGGWRAHLARTT
jgi:allophanate hydrolase